MPHPPLRRSYLARRRLHTVRQRPLTGREETNLDWQTRRSLAVSSRYRCEQTGTPLFGRRLVQFHPTTPLSFRTLDLVLAPRGHAQTASSCRSRGRIRRQTLQLSWCSAHAEQQPTKCPPKGRATSDSLPAQRAAEPLPAEPTARYR